MTNPLDFSIVAGNNLTVQVSILDQNKKPIDGTGLKVIWSMIVAGQSITKSTDAGTLAIITANPLVIGLPMLPPDTKGVTEGYYFHEFMTLDAAGNPLITITANDEKLNCGEIFVRQARTK